jgi:hypothetical protein
MPWDAIPWRPRIHLGLFVHRVEGVPRDLYALARDPDKLAALLAKSRTYGSPRYLHTASRKSNERTNDHRRYQARALNFCRAESAR